MNDSNPEPLKVLVLGGGGAVGVVYGAHLARGGAEVSVYVRPARVEEARAGFDLHRVSLFGRRATQRWVPASVLTRVEGHFDQVWLATPSDALLEPWLPEVLAACGDALVVGLQPGRAAGERMRALVPEARLVRGAIPFISWRTPLPASTDARELEATPGYAYFIPPLSAGGFEGARAAEVIGALKSGGFAAHRAKVDESLAMTSSVLLTHVVALECAGWSFAALRSSELSRLAIEASQEAAAIAARELGLRVPFAFHFVATPFTRFAMRLVGLAPFDVPTYFRVHFTKVRTQTMQILSEMISSGTALQLPVTALLSLQNRVSQRG